MPASRKERRYESYQNSLKFWNSSSRFPRALTRSSRPGVVAPTSGTLPNSVSHTDFEQTDTITKRKILSATSQVFDPLGLTLPVLVRGKLLLKRLWQEKHEWDTPLNIETMNEWNKIKNDLSHLPSLEFDRRAYDDEVSLILFCDSSKQIYGFNCYSESNTPKGLDCNLLFAKCKVAPDKNKSLPTLELLSVFLAMKCLPTLISSLQGKTIKNITICVDAQIVLSWVLTGNIKSKTMGKAQP